MHLRILSAVQLQQQQRWRRHCLLLALTVSAVAVNAASNIDVPPSPPDVVEFQSLDDSTSDSPDSQEWWEHASFYQIYPRSFKDSNADGIGDLNGINEQLPYLVNLGITATWLSPIFRSPMADFGYDISNYFDIQPEYGTLADFDRLIERAQRLGIRVLLDFVPNHTSDECEWFRLSAARDPHFADFYVWHPGFADNSTTANGGRRPPNNWISMFGGSAWEFNEQRGEFYMHAFSRKQPDLNYRNERVVEMMHSVLRFWLRRGVAGFRVDAVPYLFEVRPDAAGNYPDEPRAGGSANDPTDYGYLRHIYTTDQEETVDMVYEWRRTLDEFRRANGVEAKVMLTECYSSIDMVMSYYGNGSREGAQVPMNFGFIERINNQSTAADYQAVVDEWMAHMPAGRTPNWVVGNHDNHRIADRLGTDRVDMINMILLTLPGVSITYNGEELGMTDVWISWKDTVDPAACNTNASVYERFSRDPERTPFQWDNSTSAGFSTSTHTWLPVAANYRSVNVRTEMAGANSHLQCYRKLMKLRKQPTMQHGALTVKSIGANVLVIVRSLAGNAKTFVTVANIGGSSEQIDLHTIVELPDQLSYAVVGVSSAHTEGETVNTGSVVLQPKESFVLRAGPAAVKPARLQPDAEFYSYAIGAN